MIACPLCGNSLSLFSSWVEVDGIVVRDTGGRVLFRCACGTVYSDREAA